MVSGPAALNLNVHFHILFLDGLIARDIENAWPETLIPRATEDGGDVGLWVAP